MHSFVKRVGYAWKSAVADHSFRIESVLTGVILVLLLAGVSRYYLWVEARPGVVFSDPLLILFDAIDLTWVTFTVIYGALVLAMAGLVQTPVNLIHALQSYIVFTLFRIILMWSLPLDPPLTDMPLSDPLVEILGTGKLLTKDLFFSGHTSFIFLLCLGLQYKTEAGFPDVNLPDRHLFTTATRSLYRGCSGCAVRRLWQLQTGKKHALPPPRHQSLRHPAAEAGSAVTLPY